MKACIECVTKFIGRGERCDPCRRRFEKHVLSPPLRDLPATIAAREKHAAAQAIPPGEVCPTCGHKQPMTSAQRVHRHRAKRK